MRLHQGANEMLKYELLSVFEHPVTSVCWSGGSSQRCSGNGTSLFLLVIKGAHHCGGKTELKVGEKSRRCLRAFRAHFFFSFFNFKPAVCKCLPQTSSSNSVVTIRKRVVGTGERAGSCLVSLETAFVVSPFSSFHCMLGCLAECAGRGWFFFW